VIYEKNDAADRFYLIQQGTVLLWMPLLNPWNKRTSTDTGDRGDNVMFTRQRKGANISEQRKSLSKSSSEGMITYHRIAPTPRPYHMIS
jgi:hypothetical protein